MTTSPSGAGAACACLVHERRHPTDQLADALARDGGDHGPVPAHRLELLELHGVGLGADDEPRTVEQVGAVLGELVEQDPLLLGGRRFGRGEIDQHAQHAGTLDVAQELVAEPAALAGAFDQAGNVGDHEVGLVVERHDPEVGLERGERVVGDLRLGGRDHADQRALAGVGEADQRDVCHQLQLELEPALLAVLALLGEARRPPPVVEELGVAAPASPAGGGEEAIAVVEQLGQHFVRVEVLHDRALRHLDLERLAAPAVQILALAVNTAAGTTVRMVTEGEQRRHVVIGHQPHVAALAAVAAIGPAHDDRTLAPKRDAARPTVAAAHVELALVDELGHGVRAYRRTRDQVRRRIRPARAGRGRDSVPLERAACDGCSRSSSGCPSRPAARQVHLVSARCRRVPTRSSRRSSTGTRSTSMSAIARSGCA